MKKIRTKFLPLLLALVTILSLLPTSAFAASKTGSGIQITQNQAYWSTRLLANGTPYSYRPPLADGKLVYCMDSGLGYHYATKSFLDSFTWTSGSGADADAVLQSAITNSGLSEMDAMTIENVKWMMTYLNDCKASNVGQLFMAVQTYVWENQSYKGEPGGDGDAGGYANADTYELYLSLIDDLLAKKAAEDAEFLKQIEAYKAQGIEASIVEDASAKWAVFAISSNRKNQSFFNYYGPRKLSVGEAKPDQPEQPTGGTGKITLKKTAAGTLKGLPGARYSIYFNGQIVGSDVTGESGELHIEDAATGLWTFVETAAPSGYCLDPTPKSVYVDVSEGDREYTVAAVNYAMPSMIIYKEDAQTSAPVPGTVLSVKSVTGAYSTSVKIGESGSATLEGLEPGVYVVSEESVPEPYILSNTEQTVALRPGKTTEVHFQDYKKPGLEILKKNIANMDPIPDMTYKVEQIDGSFETTVTTDLRGRAFLADLPVGSYRISEVGGPSNVILSEIPQVIYLEAGCTRTVTFFNAIKPTLTILKQNSVTSDPLPGAKLHIYYASDNTSTGEMHDLGVFYSNEEGKVILTDAERGWYKIVEESCPQGFGFLDGEAVQEFYLEENTSKTVIIRNVPLSALVGFKYDTKTGKGIPGCRFELRYLSGNTSGTGGTVIGTYVTGPNGAFTVTGLKKGTYICEEVSSDGNHIIDSEPQTVWISGEDQDVVIIRFGNSPFGSLLITKLSDDNKRSPIPNTDFLLTYSDGTFVGNDNGIYTTNAAGEILVDGLEPGVTIIVREVRAAAGFLLDESPQHIQIKSGETVHLQFLNKPLGNLIIKKNSSAPTQEAVPGAEFEITYADGSYVDAAGGTISSNGRYVTDEHGEIRISGIVGTVVVTEIKSGPGYQLDEANRTQTVTINPGDTQTLQFYNTPISKVEFIKVDENDRSVRIPDTTIEVRRLDGALVTTLVTSESGQAFAQLEDGSYYAVETVANPKYQLDSTPVYFEVKDGKCAPVVLTNKMICGILIHKTSSTTGDGIYGVPFILYDSNHNPIAQEESDNEGYVRFEGLSAGRYFLREGDNEGYIPDKQEKTVYVKDGETTIIEWKNTPITGQIQITKYADGVNTITGQTSGVTLKGATYEITWERSGKVVDYITTDARGVAASKPLPLGRYLIREVSAPAYYQVSAETFDVTLEYAGQIIKLAAYNKPAELGVTLTKTGIKEVLAGSKMSYRFTIANTSNVDLQNFYFHDKIPYDVTTASALTTGTYNARLTYRILYKTNYNDYRVLASNLLSTNNYSFGLSGLQLMAGEVVTDIYFDFGTVPSGFQSVTKPTLMVSVNPRTANKYYVTNRADAGGKFGETWQSANASWITPMFYYPFSNVYEDERVCTGNNILPRYKKLSAMKNFPRYLLGLPDNDDMFYSAHNQKGLDHKALLEHLKDKDPSYYYTDILVPNGRTLSDFILRR